MSDSARELDLSCRLGRWRLDRLRCGVEDSDASGDDADLSSVGCITLAGGASSAASASNPRLSMPSCRFTGGASSSNSVGIVPHSASGPRPALRPVHHVRTNTHPSTSATTSTHRRNSFDRSLSPPSRAIGAGAPTHTSSERRGRPLSTDDLAATLLTTAAARGSVDDEDEDVVALLQSVSIKTVSSP
jgi:hypothetical protein